MNEHAEREIRTKLMSNVNPYAAYRTTQTVTASQTQLILMLHDGAIRFLSLALDAMKRKDYDNKSTYFNKTIDIIDHLWGTLDFNRGGEIARNLEKIYCYVHAQLVDSNFKDDPSPSLESMRHLKELREAWAAVDAKNKADQPNGVKLGSKKIGTELRVAA